MSTQQHSQSPSEWTDWVNTISARATAAAGYTSESTLSLQDEIVKSRERRETRRNRLSASGVTLGKNAALAAANDQPLQIASAGWTRGTSLNSHSYSSLTAAHTIPTQRTGPAGGGYDSNSGASVLQKRGSGPPISPLMHSAAALRPHWTGGATDATGEGTRYGSSNYASGGGGSFSAAGDRASQPNGSSGNSALRAVSREFPIEFFQKMGTHHRFRVLS